MDIYSYAYQLLPGTHPERHSIRELHMNDVVHNGNPQIGSIVWTGASYDEMLVTLDYLNDLAEADAAEKIAEQIAEQIARTIVKQMPSSATLNFEALINGPSNDGIGTASEFQAYVDGL